MTDDKTKTLQDAIGKVFAAAPVPDATWTEDEWAEHDARIAAARAAEFAQVERDRKAEQLGAMIATGGWPRRAVEAAIAADVTKPAIVKLSALDLRDRNIVVISGAAGCGKTVGVAYWALQRRTTTRFVRASTFAAASRYDRTERDTWLHATALVLDDAGAEYADLKGSLAVDLDELIDTFYGAKRPLLITTNLDVAEFKSRYGERVTDRLRECGRWVSVDGVSMRSAR